MDLLFIHFNLISDNMEDFYPRNAELLNDDESSLLAKEIAKEIETKMNFPGDIKVNVIRESRAVVYAH